MGPHCFYMSYKAVKRDNHSEEKTVLKKRASPHPSAFSSIKTLPGTIPTRNALTQASKNGRKPYLFPQKKFVSVFYAINTFNTICYFKPTNFNCAYRKFHTFFCLLTMFPVHQDLKLAAGNKSRAMAGTLHHLHMNKIF